MIDTNTRLCCAGVSFLSSLIKYFQMAALVPKLWVLQQCAISQSASLFGCMKLQLTSAKVINSLADSDCKYYYLEDSSTCRCALNGPIKEVHLQYLIPNFAWGKLIGRHITVPPERKWMVAPPRSQTLIPSPSVPPNTKLTITSTITYL